jgi:hypothetical protein
MLVVGKEVQIERTSYDGKYEGAAIWQTSDSLKPVTVTPNAPCMIIIIVVMGVRCFNST